MSDHELGKRRMLLLYRSCILCFLVLFFQLLLVYARLEAILCRRRSRRELTIGNELQQLSKSNESLRSVGAVYNKDISHHTESSGTLRRSDKGMSKDCATVDSTAAPNSTATNTGANADANVASPAGPQLNQRPARPANIGVSLESTGTRTSFTPRAFAPP